MLLSLLTEGGWDVVAPQMLALGQSTHREGALGSKMPRVLSVGESGLLDKWDCGIRTLGLVLRTSDRGSGGLIRLRGSHSLVLTYRQARIWTLSRPIM